MSKTTRSTKSQPSHLSSSNLLHYDPSKPKPKRSVHDPNSPSPTFTKGSSQEFEEDQPLTLIEDLEENRDRYRVPMTDSSTLTIRSWSEVLKLNLDRVSARVDTKPSRNSIVSACIYRGLITFRKDQRIKDFIDVRNRYKLAPSDTDIYINSIIGQLVTPSALENVGPNSKPANIAVPRNILGMLSDLAEDIGMFSHALAYITIIDELSCCKEIVMDENRAMFGDMIRRFYRSIKTRINMTEAALRELGL